MSGKFNGLPEGMRFYLPAEARAMNELRDRGKQVLENWNYEPLYIPALLPYELIVSGMSQERARDYYKLIDYQGDILVLRPEMTAAIAAMMARERENLSTPARLYYFAPVYRHESTQSGKEREIYQLGAEFFGDSELADFEVLAIAQEIIASCGLKNYRLEIGQVDFLQQYLEELGLTPEVRKRVKKSLAERDLVAFRRISSQLTGDKADRLNKLLQLRGGIEILDQAADLVSAEAGETLVSLRNIYQGLKKGSDNDEIFFDLTLVRNLDYYTGIVFEIMTPDLGYNICGGGRYDNLLGNYGSESIPAVGFALGIERLRLAWLNQKEQENFKADKNVLILLAENNYKSQALNLITSLHQQGWHTQLEKSNKDKDEPELFESASNYSWVIQLQEEENNLKYSLRELSHNNHYTADQLSEVMNIVKQ